MENIVVETSVQMHVLPENGRAESWLERNTFNTTIRTIQGRTLDDIAPPSVPGL